MGGVQSSGKVSPQQTSSLFRPLHFLRAAVQHPGLTSQPQPPLILVVYVPWSLASLWSCPYAASPLLLYSFSCHALLHPHAILSPKRFQLLPFPDKI